MKRHLQHQQKCPHEEHAHWHRKKNMTTSQRESNRFQCTSTEELHFFGQAPSLRHRFLHSWHAARDCNFNQRILQGNFSFFSPDDVWRIDFAYPGISYIAQDLFLDALDTAAFPVFFLKMLKLKWKEPFPAASPPRKPGKGEDHGGALQDQQKETGSGLYTTDTKESQQ